MIYPADLELFGGPRLHCVAIQAVDGDDVECRFRLRTVEFLNAKDLSGAVGLHSDILKETATSQCVSVRGITTVQYM